MVGKKSKMNRYDVDFHIHSKYSGGTSSNMELPLIAREAELKGLHLVGTGDALHPKWLEHLKRNLIEESYGIHFTKETKTHFLITTEVEDSRRVHHLLLLPSISSAESLMERFKKYSQDIDKDGRPHLRLSGEEIVDYARDVDALVGPAHCVPPDTLLYSIDDVKQIKDINKKDKVLTHKGNFKKLIKVYKREYHGDILRIKSRYLPESTLLTLEHPIYAIKTKTFCYQDYGICKPTCKTQVIQKKRGRNCKKYYLDYEPEWIQAKDLKVGDVILYPIIQRTKDIKKIFLEKFIDGVKANIWKKDIPPEIEVSEQFCRLVGYFLSEGSCFRDGITFSLGEDDVELIKDINKSMEEIFGLKSIVRDDTRGGGYELKYYSRILRDAFSEIFYSKNGEKRAWNKQLPSYLLYLPINKQLEIFVGWWRGDKGVTTSRILMNQINAICLRSGFILTFSKHRVKSASIGKRKVKKCHDRWQGRISIFNKEVEKKLNDRGIFSATKTNNRYGWMDNDYIYLPITKIEKLPYNGLVYNLEVEDHSSYVTESATLHNCFTPWTAIYKEYNSIADCYGQNSKRVKFLELGLSADTGLADRIPELSGITFMSNSDAHSPWPHRLGREFNRIEVKELDFNNIRNAIERKKTRKFILNVGLNPQEGKYHLSACSRCYQRFRFKDAVMLKWKCPECSGRIKKGVIDRINELARFEKPKHPWHRPPYLHIIPLAEVISMVTGIRTITSKVIQDRWTSLVDRFGTEINVLVDSDISEVKKADLDVGRIIEKFRQGRIRYVTGGGGQYGRPTLDGRRDEFWGSGQRALTEF